MISSRAADISIVGAGLSGIICAIDLKKQLGDGVIIEVLEARNRMGGRTHVVDGTSIDLGGAWTWPSDDRLRARLKDLGVALIPQNTGKLGEHSLHMGFGGRIQKFPDSLGGDESRISGGAGSVCEKLVKKFNISVSLDSSVTAINVEKDEAIVTIENSAHDTTTVRSKRVIVAAPLQLIASKISFSPSLDKRLLEVMHATPTWMCDTGKVALFYPTRFWSEKLKLSGAAMSDDGPVHQIWDNSDSEFHVLCGFVFQDASKYFIDRKTLDISPIMLQMVSLFGKEALESLIRVEYKWWGTDKHTSVVVEGDSSWGRPHARLAFGHPILAVPHCDRVFFCGTETEANEHGHMEGAVKAGERVALAVAKSLIAW